MRAIVHEEYGPPEVLQLREVPTPEPRAREVRVRNEAAVVNLGDCEMRRMDTPNAIWVLVRLAFGWRRPRKKILGAYCAGTVDAVGAEVSRWKPGDLVMGASGARFGAYAEYVCVPEKYPLAIRPANLSAAEAAGLPVGGINALHFLRKAKVQPGEHVLVNGAGGTFGTFAVQLAKRMGAEVTAVDHGDKLELCRELGADHVIDYTQEDFTDNAGAYDVIFSMVMRAPYARTVRALKPGGRYLITNPHGFWAMFRAAWTTLTSDKSVIWEFAKETTEMLDELREVCESGELRSIVDRTYPLEEAVAAHHFVESGAKLGNVVLVVNEDEP